MTTYTKTFTTDFPSGINETKLHNTLLLAFPTTYLSINTDIANDSVYLNFNTSLSPVEIGIMDGIVATHDPLPYASVSLVAGGSDGTTTVIQTTQTVNRTITLPNFTTTLVGTDSTQTLSSKNIDADTNSISNISNANIKAGAGIDATKIGNGTVTSTEFQYLDGVTSAVQTQMNARALIIHTHDGADIVSGTIPDARIAVTSITQHEASINANNLLNAPTSAIAGINDLQIFNNKTLIDATTNIVDDVDQTKKLQFQVSGVTTGTTRTLTIPNASTTIVGTDIAQTLTNKTLTSPIISTISNTGTITIPSSTDTLVGRNTTDTLINKTLTSPVISTIVNTGILTLPTVSDTLVARTTTDTLTNKTLTNPVISTISNSGTLTLPTGTDTLVARTTSDTLTNKSLVDASTFVVDDVDVTKKMRFELSGLTTATTRVLTIPNASTTIVGTDVAQTLTNKTLTSPTISTIVNSGTLTLPTSTDTLIGRATADTLTNKTLIDATTTFQDDIDATKKARFELSGIATGNTRVYTFPNVSDTLVTQTSTDTLTNKTLTSPTISSIINSGTLTLPTITDRLVGRTTTDTLTNKTIDSATNTITLAASVITSGTLGVARGGTGASTLTQDGMLMGNGTSAITAKKWKFNATVAPVVSDDNTAGYEVGSRWLNTTAGREYVCISASTGAAVWVETTNTGSSSMIIKDEGTNIANTPHTALNFVGPGLTASDAGSGVASVTFSEAGLTLDNIGGTLSVSKGGTGASALTSGNFVVGNGTGTVTTTKVVPTGVVVGTTDTQTLTNKSLVDATTFIIDDIDNTKKLQLQLSGITTATTRTLTVPDASDTLAVLATAQTLTNKNITDTGSNVTANGLRTATTTVSVASATAPSSGQVLTATSTTAATWQTPTTGETNTASNVGVGGVGVFKQKTGANLEFKNINAGTNKITITNDSANNEIDVDVAEANLTLNNIGGTLGVTKGGTGVATFTSGAILQGNGTGAITATLTAPSGTIVGTTDTQTLTNKSLVDATTFIVDDLDNTKKLQLQLSGISTGTTRTLTVPNASDTLAVQDTSQTLTNKTIIDTGSNIATNSLKTTGAVVNVSSASPPSSGQVLKATSATTATWQTLTDNGITTLNTLTATTQTLATGSSGSSFNISSSGSTHTFNLPDASLTTSGVITTNPQSLLGPKLITAPAPVIAFVGNEVNAGTNVSSLTINVPAGTNQINMQMVAFITVRNGFQDLGNLNPYLDARTITTPTGWTLVSTQSNTTSYPRTVFVYTRTVSPPEPTSYTWSGISPSPAQSLTASVTATFSGTTMTVTAVGAGTLTTGQTITGGTIPGGTTITAFGTGTGGTGTYTISNTHTAGSTTVNATAPKTNFICGGISTFSSAATYSAIDVINMTNNASSSSFTTPSITTSVVNTLVLAYVSYASATTGWSTPVGLTQAGFIGTGPLGKSPPQGMQEIGESMVNAYRFQATATTVGPYTFTADGTLDDVGISVLLALKQSNSAILTIQAAPSQGNNLYDNLSSAGDKLSGFNSSGNLFTGGSASNLFTTTIFPTAPTANRTITLPDATDTVALLTTTQTITNKVINLLQPTLGNEVMRTQSTSTNDDPIESVIQNRITTTNNTITDLHIFTVPASTTYYIHSIVVARRTGGSAGTAEDGASYEIRGCYKNDAGTATIIGALNTITNESQAGWNATFSPTGNTVRLRVTGATNNNVTWHTTSKVYYVST